VILGPGGRQVRLPRLSPEATARALGELVMKSAGLALALAAGLAGAIAGYFALVAPRPAGKVTGDTSAPLPVWAEVKWPFPIDQWGTGRAFACKAADCGSEPRVHPLSPHPRRTRGADG
jgi:hypothetical protein